jgi:hypothetical protein
MRVANGVGQRLSALSRLPARSNFSVSRRSILIRASLLFSAVLSLLPPVASARAQDLPLLDLLLERLGDYLTSYEADLSVLVADESYEQVSIRARAAGKTIARRKLQSEVAFLRLPGGGEWFGLRDVRSIDSKPVETKGRSLSQLLSRPGSDLLERAKAIVIESSRHNLDLGRTINMPTVPLEALGVHNHPRFIFKLAGKDRISGVQTQRLNFEEFDEPTLIHGLEGVSLWSRGSAWIEPATGRLWRAELVVGPTPPGKVRRRDLESRLLVHFAQDATLNLLVPREMIEEYWVARGRGTGRARYSNFRRFATSARIIPQ